MNKTIFLILPLLISIGCQTNKRTSENVKDYEAGVNAGVYMSLDVLKNAKTKSEAQDILSTFLEVQKIKIN